MYHSRQSVLYDNITSIKAHTWHVSGMVDNRCDLFVYVHKEDPNYSSFVNDTHFPVLLIKTTTSEEPQKLITIEIETSLDKNLHVFKREYAALCARRNTALGLIDNI